MRRAFLSVSFHQRQNLQKEFAEVIRVLNTLGIEAVDFVTQFSFHQGEDKDMMKQACEQIKAADILIAEVSDKAIGVGIEIGYATAIGLPVVYLRKETSDYSRTVGGIASEIVVYSNPEDLAIKLSNYFRLP